MASGICTDIPSIPLSSSLSWIAPASTVIGLCASSTVLRGHSSDPDPTQGNLLKAFDGSFCFLVPLPPLLQTVNMAGTPGLPNTHDPFPPGAPVLCAHAFPVALPHPGHHQWSQALPCPAPRALPSPPCKPQQGGVVVSSF